MDLLLVLLTLAVAGPVNAASSSGPKSSACERLILHEADIGDLPESVRGLHSTYRLLSLAVPRHRVTTVFGATDDEQSTLFDRLAEILTTRQLPFVHVRPDRVRTNLLAIERDAVGFHLDDLSSVAGPPASDLSARLPAGTVLMVEAPPGPDDLARYAAELVGLFERLDHVRASAKDLIVLWSVPSRGLDAIADAGHYRTIFDHSTHLYLERNADAPAPGRFH